MKISVITINYNNAEGLYKTVASVVGQVGLEFEYLVVDGGSTDNSLSRIAEFRDKISVLVSEKDKGIYDAQNKGMALASGEYLLFLNSGDFLCTPDVLKTAVDMKLDKDIVYGNMIINWGPNKTLGLMPDSITKEHLFSDTLWHPVSFIRRELFERYGHYDLSYSMVADYEFFVRTIIGKQVSTKHIPLTVCEFNTGGLSSDPKKKDLERAERQRVLTTYFSSAEIRDLEKASTARKGMLGRWIQKLKLKR